MDLQNIVSIIKDTGVTIAVLAYFIYRDNKFMSQLQTTLQTLVDTVNSFKDTISRLED